MSVRRPIEALLCLVMLCGAGGGLSAQEPSPANDSSDVGQVEVRSEESTVIDSSPPEPPAESPPDSSSAAPPEEPPAPPDSPSDSAPGSSPDASTDSARGPRYAVPGTPGEPRRQPPRDRQGGGSSGGQLVDGGDVVPGTAYDSEPSPEDRGEMGALDLDVSPGRTQVYLDGRYLGIVDQYDGWPAYLWLEEGTYDVVFYLDGYRTLARRVTIHPGTVVDMDDRLEPGPSVRPEDLSTRTVP